MLGNSGRDRASHRGQ